MIKSFNNLIEHIINGQRNIIRVKFLELTNTCGLSLCVVDKKPVIISPCSLSETPQRSKAWSLVYTYLLTGSLDIDPLLVHEIDFIADVWIMTLLQNHIATFVEKVTTQIFMKIDQNWLFYTLASRHPQLVLKRFMESDYKKNFYFFPAPFYNLCQWVNMKHTTKNTGFDVKKWLSVVSTVVRGDTKEVITNSDNASSFMVIFPTGVLLKPSDIKVYSNTINLEVEVREIDYKGNRVPTTEVKVNKARDSCISANIPFVIEHPIKGLEFTSKTGYMSANLGVFGDITFDISMLF